MFRIPTEVRASPIHGLGVFTLVPIARGAKVWEWDDGIDVAIPDALYQSLDPIAREHVYKHAWLANGVWLLCTDSMKFMNHAAAPNIREEEPSQGMKIRASFALRDIAAGEELTENYAAFDERYGDHGHLFT